MTLLFTENMTLQLTDYKGSGTPTMSPISTGLGEIYQYVIKTKPVYENKYTATDLRTIQDWIVTRQFAGTPGIAEINGWGGFVKQYEIAINNEQIMRSV